MALRVQEPSSSSQMPAMLYLSQYTAHTILGCKCLSWLPDPKQGWWACCHCTTQHNFYCKLEGHCPISSKPPLPILFQPQMYTVPHPVPQTAPCPFFSTEVKTLLLNPEAACSCLPACL